MAADVQTPRLAVSALPSMLMTYLTGPGSSDSSTFQETSDQNLNENQQNHFSSESLSSTPPTTLKHMPKSNTPQNSRSNPNRNSLPLVFGDMDDGYTSREGSLTSANGKSKKRSSLRAKTSYSVNHAPPKGSARHKIHVRARPLLQLHQLSASSRPMPAFELLPSAIFSPSLSRAISKSFRNRHGLCPADLAIVKAEKYHQHEESGKDEDESRDILALVCKGRKGEGNPGGKAKLFLDDGSEWEAYPLPNGGYEFFSTDEHGLGMTARWVVRRPRARRSQSASDMTTFPTEHPPKKFSFSTITPNSRRHPVIATLTNTSLEINDTYSVPSATPPSRAASPPSSDNGAEQASAEGETEDSAGPTGTSASLKALITATAVWVTIREGWCPGYKYDDFMMRSPSMKLGSSPNKSPPHSPGLPASKDEAPRRSGSIARMLRSASLLKRQSTASTQLDGTLDEAPATRASSFSSGPGRRPRAESTSTVVVHSKRPRGRRGDTVSTTGSSVQGGLDLADNNMAEEEASVEKAVADIAKNKRSSAPTPLIPALDVDSEEDHDGSTAVPSPQPDKRGSSATTSTNMSLEAKKLDLDAQPTKPRKKKGGRFRKLFCGM